MYKHELSWAFKMNTLYILIFWILSDIIYRTKAACSITQFQCADGVHCVDNSWVCDGHGDCPDESDEEITICAGRKQCLEYQQMCKNGRCLPKLWVCDGRDDCGDNTDESEEICAKRQCTQDEFRCKAPDKRCMNNRARCDGRYDCRDGSDEQGCVQATCSSVQFECHHGSCVSIKWVCDGEEDCFDGSDELDCGPRNCSMRQFQCANGKCATFEGVCDGRDDCGDKSDEMNCPVVDPNLTCNESEFKCLDGSSCIQLSWKCDGFPDCWDVSDERLCVEDCQDDQFQCHAGECVGLIYECDGKQDCPDGSDEHPLCREILAQHTPCNNLTEFDCGGRHCISLAAVCDGKHDCADGIDEGDQCNNNNSSSSSSSSNNNECLIKNGDCDDVCIDLKLGFRCACSKPGFKLAADDRTCRDIDECVEVPGSCSQSCSNTVGGFECSCSPGYILDANKRLCRAGGDNAQLIFTDRHDIRMIDLVNKNYRDVVSEARLVAAVDYKLEGGIVVWSDGTDGEILSAGFNSHRTTTLASRGSKKTGNIAGLAVDWIHDKIYWTDTGRNEICVAELIDGRHMKTLFSTHLKEARAIVVDPQTGWMFWADWGMSRIEKAGMDGSHRRTLIDKDIKWPNGLAIDRHDNRLYWIDGKLHLIARCDLNGENRETVIASRRSFGHPYDIDVFEDFIYWSDWHMRHIYSAHKVTGGNLTVVTKAPSPMSLAVVHALRQPMYPNRCVNHSCAHLCLASPTDLDESKEHSCVCGNGFRLNEDGVSCADSRPKVASQPAEDVQTKPDDAVMPGLVICSLLAVAVLIAVASYFAFRRLQTFRHHRAANFENPVYRNTRQVTFALQEPGLRISVPFNARRIEEYI